MKVVRGRDVPEAGVIEGVQCSWDERTIQPGKVKPEEALAVLDSANNRRLSTTHPVGYSHCGRGAACLMRQVGCTYDRKNGRM